MLNILCYIALIIQALIYASLAFITMIGNSNNYMAIAFIIYVLSILLLIISLKSNNKFKRLSAFFLIVSHAFMYLCFDPIYGLVYLLFAVYWFFIFLRLQNQELVLLKKYPKLYKLWPIISLVIMFISNSDIMAALVLMGLEALASFIISDKY